MQLLIRELDSTQIKNKMAAKAADLIFKRVKSGFGVDGLNKEASKTKKKKLNPLSKKYINYRKGVVDFNTRDGKRVNFKVKSPPVLGDFASPTRSNLTLSGQMLKAIKYRVNRNIEIFIDDSRRDDGESNPQIAQWVQDQGREFFALTSDELKIVVKIFDDHVTKSIKKIFG
jgi:hypothetical protein